MSLLTEACPGIGISFGEADFFSFLFVGKDVRCFFCPTCTSHIYHHQDAMPDKIIVRTLLLEGGNELPAGGEIFTEGKLAWTEDLKRSLQDVV